MIVLDTHAWLWWVGASSELIAQAPGPVGIASLSCLEVAWLAKKGRITLPLPIASFFEKAIDGAGLSLLPLTPAVAARAAFLPDVHRDPIDRVIIATAMEHDAELISKDETVARYPGVRVRWAS